MEKNTNYEQEIDLKDLMYVVAKKWRLVIGVALVLAVIMGVYKAGAVKLASDVEISAKEMETYESALNSYELQKASIEKQLTEAQRLLTAETNFLDTSPLMQLDSEKAVKLKYEIEILQSDMTSEGEVNETTIQQIVEGYVFKISSSWMEEAALRLDMGVKELAAIVSVSGDVYTNRVILNAYATSQKDAEEILGTFTTIISENQNALNVEFGDHTAVKASEYLSHNVSQEIFTKQSSYINQINSVKETIAKLEKEKTELDKTKPKMPEVAKPSAIDSGIKYMVFGFVLGGFMVAFFISVMYIMSDKPRNLKDITRRYGVKGLGEFITEEKQTSFNEVDNWIDKIFGCNKKLDMNEEMQIISANVNNYIPKDAKKILVSGSASAEWIEKITKQLSDSNSEKCFEASVGFATNHQTLEKLPNIDAVVLVEEKGLTTNSDIEAELSILRNMNKVVVGVVLC